MRLIIGFILLASLIGCGKRETVQLDDNGSLVRSNTARIELLEAQDAAQDLRLDAIDVTLASLDSRVSVNEDDIDSNEADVASLFGEIDRLDYDLSDLRDDLDSEVRRLQRADRRTRRLIRSQVRSLRRRLSHEIRARRIADRRLQSNIDGVERDLNRFESRQRFFNFLMGGAIASTNYRITLLQQNIQSQLNNLDNRISINEADISNIQSDISSLQSQANNLQSQIDDLEDKVVSVVYPCGEGNSEEVLLETQDGLVAYFQSSKTVTVNFSDSITIPAHTIPAHSDKYCEDTNFFNGECNDYGYRQVGAHTIPASSYNVNDSDSFRVIDKAYFDVLADGNYGTTDGYSCVFEIDHGQLVQSNGGN